MLSNVIVSKFGNADAVGLVAAGVEDVISALVTSVVVMDGFVEARRTPTADRISGDFSQCHADRLESV